MATFITILHYVFCVAMIVIVLLQADKGEGLSGAFGGGASSAIFGRRGASGFFTKLTTGAAIAFMLTSFTLTYMGSTSHAARDTHRPLPASSTPKTPSPPPPPGL